MAAVSPHLCLHPTVGSGLLPAALRPERLGCARPPALTALCIPRAPHPGGCQRDAGHFGVPTKPGVIGPLQQPPGQRAPASRDSWVGVSWSQPHLGPTSGAHPRLRLAPSPHPGSVRARHPTRTTHKRQRDDPRALTADTLGHNASPGPLSAPPPHPWLLPPWTAHLPQAPVTVCHRLPPVRLASCIIQVPGEAPLRALMRPARLIRWRDTGPTVDRTRPFALFVPGDRPGRERCGGSPCWLSGPQDTALS